MKFNNNNRNNGFDEGFYRLYQEVFGKKSYDKFKNQLNAPRQVSMSATDEPKQR